MRTTVKSYDSVKEFMSDLESLLATYRRELGALLRYLEELRSRVEVFKSIRDLLTKVVGREVSDEAELPSVKLRVEHPSTYEVEALEEAVEDLNRKMLRVEAIRRELMRYPELLSMEGVRIEAIIIDGVPKTLLIKIK